jgi:soluble lytic murein transglycosylase-like protein
MADKSIMKFGLLGYAIAILLLAHSASATELAVLRNGFTIRHDHHRAIGETTRLFLSADDSNFTDIPTAEITGFEKDLSLPVPPPSAATSSQQATRVQPAPAVHPPDLDTVVNSASAAYHLDPDLVNSVIHAESGFKTHAISPKGARGLMQLMPSTANSLGVKDAFDPEANVGGGSRYLRELLERYDFDLVKALAAYNAGPERVEQYNGVPPFRETRAYVARIVHEYNRKKIAQERAAAAARKKNLTAANTPTPGGAKNKAASSAPSGAEVKAKTKSPKHAASSSQLAANSSDVASPH